MSAMDSLAARLGMRRSPSGLDTTGALTQPPARLDLERESVELYQRAVAARARTFGREQMDNAPRIGPWTLTDSWTDPYGPDPLVFGPQYEQDGVQLPVVHCPACGAGWSIYGGSECWACKPP